MPEQGLGKIARENIDLRTKMERATLYMISDRLLHMKYIITIKITHTYIHIHIFFYSYFNHILFSLFTN